jgi:tetratricopeptide (TPR) repeat protein
MDRRISGRALWLSILNTVAGLAIATSAAAQGIVKGTVNDDKGQPVAEATVTIEMEGGTGRRYEIKTDKKGQYLQVGLATATYKVTAEKDKLGSAPATVRVRAATTQTANLVLGMASAAATKENAARGAELTRLFDEGVALSSAGKHNEAIEKFTAGVAINPNCFDCYNNIGFSYAQLKDWEKAEAAYKKSIEVKTDDAAAYNGLATVYNAQRKFDMAAEASAKATQYASSLSAPGGASGSADAQFNQGVILWNSGKVAEAKKSFEGALQANPNHAEAHYQLGMVLVNEGNMAGAATEFDSYLKLAPDGPNAPTAKSLLAQLKK